MPSPRELLEYAPFKARWVDAAAKAADECTAASVRATYHLEEAAGTLDEASPPDPIACASPALFALNSGDYWLAFAAQLLRTYVKLEPEVSTVSGAAAIAYQCKEKGVEGKHCVLIMYDSDLQGESQHRPADRKPPFDEEAFKTMMHGIMQGRGGAPNERGRCTTLVPGDVIMLSNGGRNLDTPFAAPFQDASGPNVQLTTVHTKTMTVTISEDSLRARKSRVKGDIQQVQTLTLVTTNSFNEVVPERSHCKYDGTNRGDAFGFVVLPQMADAWTLNVDAKRAIYGNRLVPIGAVDKDSRYHRRGNLLEPVFFNSWPSSFYENMFTVMSARAVIDCTAGSGDAAKAATCLKLPYIGVCLTAEHVTALTRHLVEWVLKAFKTEGHTLYRPQFAETTDGIPKKPAGWASVVVDGAKKDTRKRQREDGDPCEEQPNTNIWDGDTNPDSSDSDSSDI